MNLRSIRIMLGAGLGMLAASAPAWSQGTAPVGAPTATVASLQKQYADSFVAHPQLINGREYIDYSKRYHTRTGHQFFLAPEMQHGSLYYNDHYFADLRLNYDVVRDQVLLPHPTSLQTLRLINEKVRSFSIEGHQFVRLGTDSSAVSTIRPGYYEVLVDSSVQVLAKRVKRLQKQVTQLYVDVVFTSVDKLFIQKGGVYYPITKKGAALRLFSDRSKEMQRFIQDRQLKFNKGQLEASLVQLTRYYNSLTPR